MRLLVGLQGRLGATERREAAEGEGQGHRGGTRAAPPLTVAMNLLRGLEPIPPPPVHERPRGPAQSSQPPLST